MADIDLLDTASWATLTSRTRLTNVADFGPQNTNNTEPATDLQSILHAVRQLEIPNVPYRDLRALETIGEGVTFSVVKHVWGDKLVALKYIKQRNTDKTKPRDASCKRLRSLLQEILVMSHKPLAAHPNIVELLGYGWQQIQGRPEPFVVVEFGALGGLRPFLQSQKPWDLQKKLIIAGDVAAGLMALHKAGIVHGDLKLDNVICFRTWSRPTACQAKLCDFSHSITVSGEPKNVRYYGTQRYLPPEALIQRDQPISSAIVHKCDIWAFGLALWEILLDGDVYFQPKWLHDLQYSRPDSVNQSFHSAQNLSPSASPPLHVSYSDMSSDLSQQTLVFGDFDLSHLSTFACAAVDQLTCDAASQLEFARSYLRPLLRRTLEPDPKIRVSDIARWPIDSQWQIVSCQNTTESKLAFSTYTSHFTFDIFRPDRQANIPWSVQVHIHDDLQSILASSQQNSYSSHVSLQLAWCKTFGFGCDIDLAKAATYLEPGFVHYSALAEFMGQAIQTVFGLHVGSWVPHFADRVATIFASQWHLDRHSTVSLCKKSINGASSGHGQHVTEPLRLDTFSDIQQLLVQAAKWSDSSTEAILSDSSVCYDDEKVCLSWLELAIFHNDLGFINTHWETFSPKDRNRISAWTLSPLMFACVRGQAAMVRRLLELGADPILETPDGCNLLHFLFCLKHEAAGILHGVMRLYPKLVDKINSPCKKAFSLHTQWSTEIEGSPLAIAVTVGHLQLTEALLSYTALPWLPAFEPRISSHDYIWTPMHLAIRYNFCEIAMLFIERRPLNTSGWLYAFGSPLASALSFLTTVEREVIHGSTSQAALDRTVSLVQHDEFYKSDANAKGVTAILQAIKFENFDVVRALLKHDPTLAIKVVPDPLYASDFTLPFHFACHVCSRKDVQYALNIPKAVLDVHGAALTMIDRLGRSALHLAVTSESSLVARWLLDKGLDVDHQDFMGRSPLMLCQSIELSTVLVKTGAKLDLRDRDGRNAAHYAASHGDHEILALLLKHGVQPDSTTNSLRTPLHDAVSAASLECVRMLCQAGASIDAVTRDGFTPLHLAITTTIEIVRELVKQGSNYSIADDSGHKLFKAAATQLAGSTDDADRAQTIFEALIRPLQGDFDVQERNKDLIAQILHTCATHGSGRSIQIFFEHLGQNTPITANTLWHGVPPLHAAASTINVDAARALVAMPTLEVNAFDCHNHTALMHLSTLSSANPKIEEFCGLICKAGAHLDMVNARMETAWSIAIRHNNFQMLAYLLSKAPAEISREMLEAHPVTKSCLLVAIDAGHDVFVTVFLERVSTMPLSYGYSTLDSLANACGCLPDWAAVSKRLRFLCRKEPAVVRDVLLGIKIDWKLKRRLDLELGDHDSTPWPERKVTSLWDQRATRRAGR